MYALNPLLATKNCTPQNIQGIILLILFKSDVYNGNVPLHGGSSVDEMGTGAQARTGLNLVPALNGAGAARERKPLRNQPQERLAPSRRLELLTC